MADYHIQTQTEDQKTAKVIFHFPTPNGNNDASISWQNAWLRSNNGVVTTVLADAYIDPAEKTNIEAGSVIEHVDVVRFSSLNLTNAERRTEIENKYNTVKSEYYARLQVELTFIGFEGTVV